MHAYIIYQSYLLSINICHFSSIYLSSIFLYYLSIYQLFVYLPIYQSSTLYISFAYHLWILYLLSTSHLSIIHVSTIGYLSIIYLTPPPSIPYLFIYFTDEATPRRSPLLLPFPNFISLLQMRSLISSQVTIFTYLLGPTIRLQNPFIDRYQQETY